jgi:hypothetical protein
VEQAEGAGLVAVSFQLSKIRCHSEPLAAAQRAERASEESAFLQLERTADSSPLTQFGITSGLPKSEAQSYRNSSIAAASASLPGRVTDSGSVASGSSTMFSISRKLGDFVFT